MILDEVLPDLKWLEIGNLLGVLRVHEEDTHLPGFPEEEGFELWHTLGFGDNDCLGLARVVDIIVLPLFLLNWLLERPVLATVLAFLPRHHVFPELLPNLLR